MTEPPIESADDGVAGDVPTSLTLAAFRARGGDRATRAPALAARHRELDRPAVAEAMTWVWGRWPIVGGDDDVGDRCSRVGLDRGRSRLRRRRREVATVVVPEDRTAG